MNNFQPIIKWSGSKRSQTEEILNHFPSEINTYYEPFCGGASVLYGLMNNKNIKVKEFVCSDNNKDLIDLWNYIKIEKESLKNAYRELWSNLNSRPTQQEKKEYYEYVRENFNKTRTPFLFLFLNRTCFNGLIRYNSKGDFNTSFHLNRNGIHPDKLDKIIDEWSDLLVKNNVIFKCCSFQEITPDKNDFLYLDPPYAHTKGMYQEGEFNNGELFEYLKGLDCGYVLSYDGLSGNDNNMFPVPKQIYDSHILIKSGNSSFKRIKESNKNAMVYESLYIKK